ncbi:hypothetical protein V8C44DRAFT_202065 [Trichoderma aethiopicum]
MPRLEHGKIMRLKPGTATALFASVLSHSKSAERAVDGTARHALPLLLRPADELRPTALLPLPCLPPIFGGDMRSQGMYLTCPSTCWCLSCSSSTAPSWCCHLQALRVNDAEDPALVPPGHPSRPSASGTRTHACPFFPRPHVRCPISVLRNGARDAWLMQMESHPMMYSRLSQGPLNCTFGGD